MSDSDEAVTPGFYVGDIDGCEHPDRRRLSRAGTTKRMEQLFDGFASMILTAEENGDAYLVGYLKSMRSSFAELVYVDFPRPATSEADCIKATAQVMEQAQVYASAWSLVGGRFDKGSGLDDAIKEKDALRTMVEAAVRKGGAL